MGPRDEPGRRSPLRLAKPLGHPVRLGNVRATRRLLTIGSLGAPRIKRVFVLPTLSRLLLQAPLGFTHAGVEELPQRYLRAFAYLVYADLVGAMADVSPSTAPDLVPTGLYRPSEGVVPLGVRVALDRHDENEAFFGRLDLSGWPVRASLHS